jgi:hypothetical protein
VKRLDGWIVLADISGYTAFLTQTALEHAQAILEELLGGLHKSLSAPLRVIKLEGDAVLACAPSDVLSGDELLARLLEVYRSFRLHVLSIERCTTCRCDACSAAGTLDLKLVVHRGEFVEQRIGAATDLQGSAVVLAHRLLKNHVVERTGFAAYAIATDAVPFSDVVAARFVLHTEIYEHFGAASCRVLDLHEALERDFGARAVRVERADVVTRYELPVDVEAAWAWHFDARRRRRWDRATVGELRLGGAVECTHADGCRVRMRIVDWRPFRYVSFENEPVPFGRGWYPATRTTIEFEPSTRGTVVTHRVEVRQQGVLGWVARTLLRGDLAHDGRVASHDLVAHLSNAG